MPLLDLLFPPVVTYPELRESLGPPVVMRAPELRGKGMRHLDCLRAATPYEGELLRRAVWFYKYRNVRGLANALGRVLVGRVARSASVPSGVVLCPVPLHWTRSLVRGYNQAALLADVVSRETGLPVCNLLRRTRPTGSQMRRSRSERLKAVRNAFVSKGSGPFLPARLSRGPDPKVLTPPSHVILIDDLSTTGATLDACAEALKNAGAEYVEGWVLAHG